MSTVRVYQASLNVVSVSKVRVYQTSLSGSTPANAKVRVYKASFSGTAAVVVAPLSPVTVDPETTVSYTASLTDVTMADSWTWRVVSGSATLTSSANTTSFTAPSTMPQDSGTVVLGVTATAGGVTSAEAFVTVTVLPQVRWQYQSGAWVGRTQTPLS